MVIPILVIVTVFLALGEELGWRGYLLPLLQTRYSAALASIVLGSFWFLWHVLFPYLPGTANTGFPLGPWAVSVVATAFVYTWLFNNTGGSVLAVTLTPGLFNTVGQFVALHPNVTGDPLSAYVITRSESPRRAHHPRSLRAGVVYPTIGWQHTARSGYE